MLCLAVAIFTGLSCAMALAWRIQRGTGQSGYIDAIWAGATGVFALIAIFFVSGPLSDLWRAALVAGFVACWALRLAGHIFARSRGAAEDPRYRELARRWGADFPRKLFGFLQIQAAAALPLVAAATAAASSGRDFPDLFDLAGSLVAVAALAGETFADRQLAEHRRRRAGSGQGAGQGAGQAAGICREGLWGWSRHPNYFFEFLFWCAMPLFAGPTLGGLVALAAPALIYTLLVHVSGVPPLEAHLRATRGEAFEAWRREVNCFFPGPPRR